ncbi:hypothetical protein KUL156_43000 [Alteromonas sp. KUL156]|nr:hypothetical protein KUL154_18650 [Alteromonas sp. KUL154]GFE01708.1 hypothetical protein KUL156_43000 [Alteromonas sp. KUL156]
MWYIIIFIIGLVIIKFIRDTSIEKNKVSASGGIRKKYSRVIDLLLQGDSRTKIFHQDSLSIKLGLVVTGASSVFVLTQNYGELLVECSFKSNVYGDYKLEWHFKENANQEKMYEKICLDIERENIKIGLA